MNHTYTVKSHHHINIFSVINSFTRKNIVLIIALIAAAVTSIIVPPSSEYLSYIDFKTLTCLFCTLAVVCALKNIGFFTFLAHKIIAITGNIKLSVLSLVYITFIGSMLIANDMALLTFLPLGYYVLKDTKKEKYMAFTFIMQNIAANLGGMLTPFGNPQNLYLYSYFKIPTLEFTQIMLPLFILATLLITALCLVCIKSEKIKSIEFKNESLPRGKTVFYLVLFACAIISVFSIIPYTVGLIIITASLLFTDRYALCKVDYSLLLTFVCFFIFAGNMSRIDVVKDLFSFLLQKNTLIFSVISCQFISNVPTAVLLSHFTDNYPALLMGVNIGGAGTLIASLASLITFREFSSHHPEKITKYIGLFSVINFGFAIILTLFSIYVCGV